MSPYIMQFVPRFAKLISLILYSIISSFLSFTQFRFQMIMDLIIQEPIPNLSLSFWFVTLNSSNCNNTASLHILTLIVIIYTYVHPCTLEERVKLDRYLSFSDFMYCYSNAFVVDADCTRI
jgi:hypothetical protein